VIPYSLVEVDPGSYSRLAHETGVGGFRSGALSGAARDGVLPAVVSPALAGQFGSRSFAVNSDVGRLMVRAAAVATTMPAAPATDFVIVSTPELRRTHPTASAGQLAPTSMFLLGDRLDAARLRNAVGSDAHGTSVTTLTQVRARFGTPLQSAARRVYLAAALAGAGYGALALLLSLLQAAPQRATLLARLRTMGMARRQFRWLAVLEMAPQAVLAAGGGVLVSLAALALLGTDMNVQVLAFGADQSGWPPGPALVLRADPLSLAVPAVAALVLAYAVLWAQVWWAGRRGEATEARIGDRL
jgi:putative ABC transport system permease protein